MEHRIYLPIAGFIIVLLETDLFKNLNVKKPGSLVLIVPAILILSIITFRHSGNLKNRVNFWQNAVRTSPHSFVAHINRGQAYRLDGFFDKAGQETLKAIELAPEKPVGYNVLGSLYMEKNMFKEAEIEFKKTLAIDPLYADARHNLGIAYFKQGKLKELKELLKNPPSE